MSGESLIGTSTAARYLELEISDAARSDAKVLLTGESGVGKEVVARLIHQQSRRRNVKLVALNCAAVPDSLLESELFGHVRGSFTGAYRDKPGLLELANSGTIFLDEIGETSLRMQALMLRFLENGEIWRIGADRVQATTDVRVIAATNRELAGSDCPARVPCGPVLPAERAAHQDSAAARAARRHSAVPRSLLARVLGAPPDAGAGAHAGGACGADCLRLARQRPRAEEPRSSAGRSRRDRVRSTKPISRAEVLGLSPSPHRTGGRVKRAPVRTRADELYDEMVVAGRVVLVGRASVVHRARHDSRRHARDHLARPDPDARQLSAGAAAVQHARGGLQGVPELPAQAPVPHAVLQVPVPAAGFGVDGRR